MNPLAPAQLQPLTCRKKPVGAKTNRASSIPAGGSAERAKDAPDAAAPGAGGRRWPCPGITAPGPGSSGTGCHGIHTAALGVLAVQGRFGAGGGCRWDPKCCPRCRGCCSSPKAERDVKSHKHEGEVQPKRAAPGWIAPALAPAPSSVAITGFLSLCAREFNKPSTFCWSQPRLIP